MEKEMLLKVGEWGVITTLSSEKYGKIIGIIGHIFQVGSISRSYYNYTKETHIAGGCMPEDCIRKALPEEIPGYKPLITDSYDIY